MQKHEEIHKKRGEIFINNFIGGIAWGLGATVGGTLILTLIGIILSKLDLVPIAGDFVAEVTSYVEQVKGIR